MGLLDIRSLGDAISYFYNNTFESIPKDYQAMLSVGLLTVIILLFAFFSWKTCKSLSKRDMLSLDLHKYNSAKHPIVRKVYALMLYFVEYLLLLPLMIGIWIIVFSIFLILLNSHMSVFNATLVSAAIISAVRIISYIKEDFAITIATLIPFNLLALALAEIDSITVNGVIEQSKQIYLVIPTATYFFIFIIIIELIMRSFTLLFNIDEIDPLDKN
jgi:hypothetical protein